MTDIPPTEPPASDPAIPPGYPHVNPMLPPYAPPNPYAGQGNWGAPPQPQAPQWPYVGTQPYAPYPPMPEQEEIGPNHVPWRWYDVLIAALPLILTVALNLVVAILPAGSATTTADDKPISTQVLIANTIVGIVIYGIILLLVWLVTIRKYRVGWSALGLRRVPGLFFALFVPILLGMYFAAGIASVIIVKLFYGGNAVNPQEKDITGGGNFSWLKLALALITASVAAPIIEELLFRGVLYGWLRTRWSAVGGVILSAAIFSGAHAIPLILASIFIVGITLAIVYEKTKSTLATMMLHSAFNTIGVVLVFVQLARK